jgi:hypothetical protein
MQMNVIELSVGVYPVPECISQWQQSIPKRKDGQLDRRNPEAKEFHRYIDNMEYLSIQAMQNNIPFRLMTKSEWWI